MNYLVKRSIYFFALAIGSSLAILFLSTFFDDIASLTTGYIGFVITIVCIVVTSFIISGIMYLYDRSDAYFSGYRGERYVNKTLRQLPSQYITFSDIPTNGSGNVDAVTIGPTGIFAIEVKTTMRGGESISAHNGALYVNDRKTRYVTQGLGNAFVIHDLIKQQLGIDIYVHCIIVFSFQKVRIRFGKRKVGHCYVVGRNWLNKIILEESDQISKPLIEKIAHVITQFRNDREKLLVHAPKNQESTKIRVA